MKEAILNRRRFLQVSGALTLGPLLPAAAVSFAQSTPAPLGRFFLLIRVHGGMDVTLGLDPWRDPALPLPTDMFVEYRPEDLLEITPTMKLGPACAALKKHAGTFSVINGVFLSQVDNGHDASLAYASTGSTASQAATLPVEVARATREGDFGVLSNLSLQMGDRTTATSSLDDLRALPARADLSGILETIFAAGGDSGYYSAVKKVLESRASTQTLIKNLLAFGKPEELTDAQVLASAFMSNISTSAQLDISQLPLDTHANHAGAHLAQQTIAWNRVDEVISLFKATPYGTGGESLFDRTVVMVVSEFARTPALNGSGGKDHNPMTNSVLIGGYGVKGGLVVGASRLVKASESRTGESYHIAYPIDYATGEVQFSRTPQAQMIFPENVAQTVGQIMQVDSALFQSIPAETLPLAALIRS